MKNIEGKLEVEVYNKEGDLEDVKNLIAGQKVEVTTRVRIVE